MEELNLNGNSERITPKRRWPNYLELLGTFQKHLQFNRSEHPSIEQESFENDVLKLFFAETVKIGSVFDLDRCETNPKLLQERVAELFNTLLYPVDRIEPSQIRVSRISSALTNLVFAVDLENPPLRLPTNPRPPLLEDISGSGTLYPSSVLPSKYILRIYGSGIDEMIDRNNELYWINVLGKLGIGARVLGLFKNGRLEEFISSRTLGKNDIRNHEISKKIASRMCELHKLVDFIPATNRKLRTSASNIALAVENSPEITQSCQIYPELWANLESWVFLLIRKLDHLKELCNTSTSTTSTTRSMEILLKLNQLPAYLKSYKRWIKTNKFSKAVLAHNDLQYGNILELSKTGDLMVVDYEYAGYNYRGADIANHFTEWMADYSAADSHVLRDSAFPTLEQRYAFYRSYLNTDEYLDASIEKNQSQSQSQSQSQEGRKTNPVFNPIETSSNIEDSYQSELEHELKNEQQQLRSMDAEVLQFVPIIHLQWGIWGLIQACLSTIDFNYLEYGLQRVQRFLDFFEQNLTLAQV